MPLGADRLHHRHVHASVGLQSIVEPAHALDVHVVAGRIDDASLAHHVVDDDDAARMRELDRPVEVVGEPRSIGVDEDEIERRLLFGGDLRQHIQRLAETNLDAIGKRGALDVYARNVRMRRVGFDGDQAPMARQRAREPDRAVAGQRADLEDPLRAERSRHQVQELPLRGRHAHGRQLRLHRGVGSRLERRIRCDHDAVDVVVDFFPELLTHDLRRFSSSSSR